MEILITLLVFTVLLGTFVCVVRVGLLFVEGYIKCGFNFLQHFHFYKSKNLGMWLYGMLVGFGIIVAIAYLLLRFFPETYSINSDLASIYNLTEKFAL